MRKILIIFMMVAILLTFAACGQDATETETTGHNHSYSEEITTPATCEESGLKTLTCSCGDTKTQRISPTGHQMSGWIEGNAPTYTAKGEELRGCNNCGLTESRELAQLDPTEEFRSYPGVLHTLGFFTSADSLTAERIFAWALENLEPDAENKDHENYIFAYSYTVEALDALTVRYFGKTWDYTEIECTAPYDSTEYVYDADAKTVTVVYYGAFGDAPPEATYESYVAIDDTHFEITYIENNWYDAPFKVVLKLQLVEDQFVVTAQEKAA